jgi:hypothetical protein
VRNKIDTGQIRRQLGGDDAMGHELFYDIQLGVLRSSIDTAFAMARSINSIIASELAFL